MPVTAALDAGPGLQVVLAHYAPGEGCKPHRHGGAQVSLVLAGGYREDSDAGEVVVDGAALSAKPAGFEHENLFGETGALILAVNLPQAAPFASYRVARGIAGGAAALAGASRTGVGAVAALAMHLPLADGKLPVRDDGLDDVRRRLAADDRARSKALARTLGLHPVQFARQFREAFGEAPRTVRLWGRTSRAIDRIVRTAMPLAELACAEGFADQAHMTRAVKQATGFAPARLRRLLAAG